MKKFDSVLLKVFLYGLPMVALLAIFSYYYSAEAVQCGSAYVRLLNGLTGLVLALWMVLTLFLSLRLILSGPLRDLVIARITFIRERDEREAILTGKATKTAFLTSLAFLILLFCLSCFQVSIYRMPPEKAIGNRTGIVTLGMGFNILEQGRQDESRDMNGKRDVFTYRGLPFSSTTIILMLIAWQIISYNCSIRRLLK